MSGEANGVFKRSRRRLVRGTAAAAASALAGGSIRPAAARQSSHLAAAPRRQDQQISFALSEDDLPRVQPLLEDYEAQTGVLVQATSFPNLYQQLNIELTLGSCTFDVVSMDDPWLPLFAGGGFLTNLEELAAGMRVELDTSDFVPAFLVLGEVSEAPGLRALPSIGNVQVFAWRADVLQELGLNRPQTWDDVLATARAVRDAGRPDLYGAGIRGLPGNDAATTFLPILRGHGADIFNADWEPQLATDQARAAMGTLLALAELAPPGVETVGHVQLGKQLYTGQIAQAADIWPNQMLQVSDPELSTVVGKVDIGREPTQPGAEPASMTGNWLLGIPHGCAQHAKEALEFILWLTAPTQQKRLLMESELPPTRAGVFQDQEAVARLPFLPGLLEAAQNAAARPRTVLYPAVEDILGRRVAQAVARQITGDEALATANQEIRALMVREGVLTD